MGSEVRGEGGAVGQQALDRMQLNVNGLPGGLTAVWHVPKAAGAKAASQGPEDRQELRVGAACWLR